MFRVLLLTAAVAYSGIPWEAAAGFPLDPSRSYLSELAAADQPNGLVFRALDAATGVLILAALAIRGRAAATTGLTTGAAFALGAFAVLTIVDASLPMACATSASAACAQADAANTLGLSHQIHTMSSAGALTAVLVSAVLLVMALTRDRAPRSGGIRALEIVAWIVVAMLVATTVLVTVITVASTADGRLLDGGGLAQRAQVLWVSSYLVVFGLIAGPRRSDPRPAARTGAASIR